MWKRNLVVLMVLALMTARGIGLASAQNSTRINVVTLGETNVFTDASAEAEVAAVLPVGTVTAVLGVSGDFFAVEGGYVMASDVAIMNLPALAPRMVVSTSKAGATALLAEPDISSAILTTLDDGTVATLLAAAGPLVLVESAGQRGWSIATDWDTAPGGLATALIQLGTTDQVGVFAEANINAAITGTLTQGDLVYIYEDTGEDMVKVMLPGGALGYVRRMYLGLLPPVWADAVAGSQTNPALFDRPDFGGSVITTLPDGAVVTYLAQVDDFWIEVYYAPTGQGYMLTNSLSKVYARGTVQEVNALVRNGAGTQYAAVAQLQPGDPVLVLGLEGDWFHIAIPYENYFAFDARDVYIFRDLLANAALEYDFDITLFTDAAD